MLFPGRDDGTSERASIQFPKDDRDQLSVLDPLPSGPQHSTSIELQTQPTLITITMQIPIAGAILSSLAMVQAFTTFEIIFWSDKNCGGLVSHRMTGNGDLTCGKPAGTPNSFDAKSAQVKLLQTCGVTFFTDNNQQCDASATTMTHVAVVDPPGVGCVELPYGKVGKWQAASVMCQ
ncbi:unnamed protein product [Zymoseptoria tritici ST99CH_1A5]|uniref:Uncharacterized protein n=1 Tax=Zymoseptoria tritici ST99CH_1A5 TaxID=1276529 RepID=A0A1Y6LW78_ZYMTR|nr:unnamed protein product [Zymoseptoria tritici ST99CH_1A5]